MTMWPERGKTMVPLDFWWAFALRGGFALVFACVLRMAASLMGTLFFDPVMLVSIALLLGSYVFGNGLLSGVAAIYARHRKLRVWAVMCAEAAFAIVLAGYIGFQLMMTSESIAWLAGLHAFGTAGFGFGMAVTLRSHRLLCGLLCASATVSSVAALVFLLNREQDVRTLTVWLSGFELLFGVLVLGLAWALHHEVATEAEQRGEVVAVGMRV